MSSLCSEEDSDVYNSPDEAEDETAEPDGTADQEPANNTSKQYLPQDNNAKEMAEYAFREKKIPVMLMVSLTSGASSFPRRYLINENRQQKLKDSITKYDKLIFCKSW